jgi:hypothetical protein
MWDCLGYMQGFEANTRAMTKTKSIFWLFKNLPVSKVMAIELPHPENKQDY